MQLNRRGLHVCEDSSPFVTIIIEEAGGAGVGLSPDHVRGCCCRLFLVATGQTYASYSEHSQLAFHLPPAQKRACRLPTSTGRYEFLIIYMLFSYTVINGTTVVLALRHRRSLWSRNILAMRWSYTTKRSIHTHIYLDACGYIRLSVLFFSMSTYL